MEDYRLQQTGAEVQEILNTSTPQADLTAETERAQEAESALGGRIDDEELRAKAAEEQNAGAIHDEELRAKAAEEINANAIASINEKIPSAASSENKLADVDFVNDSISTATATYRGSFNLVSDLHLAIDATHEQIAFNLGNAISEADNNDYCYVQIPTSAETPTQIASVERYKFTTGGWSYEYTINNSGFTAAQWAALNSGITSGLVGKLGDLPTATELAALLAGKQNTLTFDNVPTQGSNNPVKSGGVYSAIDDEKGARVNNVNTLQGEIDGIEGKIPAAATSENKLVDESKMNSAIATATATFRGSYNLVTDLGLAVTASHEQIAAALAGAISTSDKNDYAFVMIPTSAETPTQIASVERYKNNGEGWGFEYALNNSGFTSAQWAALNSGITSGLVAKLGDLPTATELTALLAGKQDTLTFDNVPTQDSANPVKSGGVYTATKNLSDAIEAILLLIPSAASSLNKLVDNELLNSSIATATATFRGTYNLVSDLHLGIDASHAQIATMLGSVAPLSDNNDYCFVQIPTSATDPTQIAQTDRYKFSGSAWLFEYTLNNSGFSAAQWAAINSGITAALVGDIQDLETLIPAEASAQNQLADKVYVLAQIIANIPAFKGQFETLLELQSVTGAKSGDLGIVRTKDSDGMDVFTFYQYLNSQWNAYYTLSHHPQTKPATTGTTGAYPYNGMGKVVLKKTMVEGENILTQEAFEDGEGNPLTNTFFVIKYDFVLGEDVTIPADCILEFDGGSISGAYTVTGNGTGIHADLVKILGTDVTLAGSFKGIGYPEWFGSFPFSTATPRDTTYTCVATAINKLYGVFSDVELQHGFYNSYSGVTINVGSGLCGKKDSSIVATGYSDNFVAVNFGQPGTDPNNRLWNGFINGVRIELYEPYSVAKKTTALNIGSTTRCSISNIFIANRGLRTAELSQSEFAAPEDCCNCGITLAGDSELLSIQNYYIGADIAILIKHPVDHLDLLDGAIGIGDYGFGSIYGNDISIGSNVLINGLNVAKGLCAFKFYISTQTPVNITNFRIEQITRQFMIDSAVSNNVIDIKGANGRITFDHARIGGLANYIHVSGSMSCDFRNCYIIPHSSIINADFIKTDLEGNSNVKFVDCIIETSEKFNINDGSFIIHGTSTPILESQNTVNAGFFNGEIRHYSQDATNFVYGLFNSAQPFTYETLGFASKEILFKLIQANRPIVDTITPFVQVGMKFILEMEYVGQLGYQKIAALYNIDSQDGSNRFIPALVDTIETIGDDIFVLDDDYSGSSNPEGKLVIYQSTTNSPNTGCLSLLNTRYTNPGNMRLKIKWICPSWDGNRN